MQVKVSLAAGVSAVLLFSSSLFAQGVPGALPMEPAHETGASVTGAFEGWFSNPDGTFSILVGYYNRNSKQVIDIPVGPNNKIEPGGPDRGQPTHFLTGRQWGVFTIQVPKDGDRNGSPGALRRMARLRRFRLISTRRGKYRPTSTPAWISRRSFPSLKPVRS